MASPTYVPMTAVQAVELDDSGAMVHQASIPGPLREYHRTDSHPSVRNSITFEDRLCPPNVVRAIYCKYVLRYWGYIFEQSFTPSGDTAEEIFALSFSSETIERFLSHSWAASRFEKWSALAHLYLARRGVMIALSFWLLATTSFYVLRKSQGVVNFGLSFTLFVVTPVLILGLALSTGHVFENRSVFLDKMCIHQTDNKLKMAGIIHLGSFLKISQKLTILCSDDYFHRLWCVFEIAMFGSIHGAKKMEFVPLWVCPFLYGMLALNVLVMLIASFLLSSTWFPRLLEFWGIARGVGMFWVISNIVPAIGVCFMLRQKARRRRDIDALMKNFLLDSSKVTHESDRPIVYDRIRRLFNTTEEFELFVQTDLRENVFQALGAPWDVPFQWGLVIFFPYVFYGSTDSFSISDDGVAAQGLSSWREYFAINFMFYASCWLLLPFALKATGVSTYFTQRLPVLVAMPIDVVVHLLVLFLVVTVTSYSQFRYLWGINDETVLQPLHNVTICALLGF